jgi:hypothetical protein
MRVINRTAITVVGAQPYVDWTRARDVAFAPAKERRSSTAGDGHGLSVMIPRAKPYGSAYLLPEGVAEEDLLEWIEDNYATLFESQLSAWTEDESAWPERRDLKTFREWFRVDLHSVVVDVSDDEIEGEDI